MNFPSSRSYSLYQKRNYSLTPIPFKGKEFLDLAEYNKIFQLTRILTECDKKLAKLEHPCQSLDILSIKTHFFLPSIHHANIGHENNLSCLLIRSYLFT